MKKILIVAKKEFLDTFRDKRTLVRMILIPLLAFPLIINIMTTVQSSEMEKAAAKELKIGYVLNNQSSEMIDSLAMSPNYNFIAYTDTAALRADVVSQEINLGIGLTPTFDDDFNAGNQASFDLFYRQADSEEYDRFNVLLEKQEERLINKRLSEKSLAPMFIKPIKINLLNQSSLKEVIGKYAGGILPYLFMAFCFMGCMLPAIDLFAGEKERGTLETLLTTPVNRLHILLGKMIVVTAFGLISATVALIGLFLSLKMVKEGGEMMDVISGMLSTELILTLYVLLIPLAIFFAGIMIPISVYSRSFKEAQSILTPLNMAVILPAMVGFIPGIELNATLAFVPIVNVVLATKAIIAGNIEMIPLAITFITLIALAAIAVFISVRQFGKETNVLR
ncbi:ABC transporter permease [Crocinitomix catalasitica]|uniref:ABC transporter permease n=1 Tax=Crocinitomix catalasitica TaxID=184607 RepID=UPI0004894218|nr:ABC transporter permease [Crocinitomix catalasitica]